jgi:hypothetical protein
MAASLAPLDWHEEAAIYDNLIRTNGVVPLTRRSDVANLRDRRRPCGRVLLPRASRFIGTINPAPTRSAQFSSSRMWAWLHDVEPELVKKIRHDLFGGRVCPALTAPAARRPAVLHQPRTSFSLYAGQDFVEVLTKFRVQYRSHGDVRFVDVRRY